MMQVMTSFAEHRRKLSLNDLRDERLRVIREEDLRTPESVSCRLHELKLVSKNYGVRNAKVDLWFLNERSTKKNCSIELLAEALSDPYSILLMAILVDALRDFFHGRPCDEGAWRIDKPPEYRGSHCTKSDHICKDSAEFYLRNFDHRFEKYLNLSQGFIVRLIERG